MLPLVQLARARLDESARHAALGAEREREVAAAPGHVEHPAPAPQALSPPELRREEVGHDAGPPGRIGVGVELVFG